MIDWLPLVVVIAAGLYLVGLAAASLMAPEVAKRFLLGFAGSAAVHFLELVLRMIAGVAFVLHGPKMRIPVAFTAFGWVLVATTAILIAVPWKWHRRFAERSVPLVVPYIRLIGLASLGLGSLIIWAAIR